jgi:hypothetical protein
LAAENKQFSTLSLADELLKLSKLKEQGIITEQEFQMMKHDIIKKLQYIKPVTLPVSLTLLLQRSI